MLLKLVAQAAPMERRAHRRRPFFYRVQVRDLILPANGCLKSCELFCLAEAMSAERPQKLATSRRKHRLWYTRTICFLPVAFQIPMLRYSAFGNSTTAQRAGTTSPWRGTRDRLHSPRD